MIFVSFLFLFGSVAVELRSYSTWLDWNSMPEGEEIGEISDASQPDNSLAHSSRAELEAELSTTEGLPPPDYSMLRDNNRAGVRKRTNGQGVQSQPQAFPGAKVKLKSGAVARLLSTPFDCPERLQKGSPSSFASKISSELSELSTLSQSELTQTIHHHRHHKHNHYHQHSENIVFVETPAVQCVRAYFESAEDDLQGRMAVINSDAVASVLSNPKGKSKFKDRRDTLAKLLQPINKDDDISNVRAGSAMTHALFYVFPALPLFGFINEGTYWGSSSANSYGSLSSPLVNTAGVPAWTGRQIHAAVCAIVNSLNKEHKISRSGDSRQLNVFFGNQKGERYMKLLLSGLMGNYNTFMMVSYMDMGETLLHFANYYRLRQLVLFVPSFSAYGKEACKLFKALPRHVSTQVLATLADDEAHTLGQGLEGLCGDTVSFTSFQAIAGKEAVERYDCSSVPTAPPPSGAAAAHFVIARSNAFGKTEAVLYKHNEVMMLEVPAVMNQLRNDEWETAISVTNTPFSSGDITEFLDALLAGSFSAVLELGWARSEIASVLLDVNEVGGSPVQLEQAVEEIQMKAAVLNRKHAVRLTGEQGTCNSGGGAPNPATARFLKETEQCPSVEQSWGSYENFEIGSGEHGIYTADKDNVLHWDLRDFGPYKRKNGQGELLLATRHVSEHPDKAITSARYEKIDGALFYHTRDVVAVHSGASRSFSPLHLAAAAKQRMEDEGVQDPDSDVKWEMIDKTTTPFRLSNHKWVRTGVVERQLEGNQKDVSRAAVFGSEETDGVAALVWLNPASGLVGMPRKQLLQRLRERLARPASDRGLAPQDVAFAEAFPLHAWELPIRVVLADEPWEYRPRAKVRDLLRQKFGSAVNTVLPGAVTEHAGSFNMHVKKNDKFSKLIRGELSKLLDTGGAQQDHFCNCPHQEEAVTLCDILLGCVEGRCMLRGGPNGAHEQLREPTLSYKPYTPGQEQSATDRVHRFDDEPWHFWDLPRSRWNQPVEKVITKLVELGENSPAVSKLRETLPLMMPSLGLLHPFGVRFRMRLDCALRLAKWAPHLLQELDSASVAPQVYKICRPEYSFE